MSAALKRINPRRVFQLGPNGLKRIVLGESNAGGVSAPIVAGHRGAAPKPTRLLGEAIHTILVIAHADRGALNGHAMQVIAAAALLAGQDTAVAVLVLGALTQDLQSAGADLVFAVPQCDKQIFDPELELAVALHVVAQLAPRHIALPDNGTGDGDLGRRLAARLGADVAGHVVELKPDGVAAYWQGGALLARRNLPRVLLLEPDVTETELPFVGAGAARAFDLPAVQTGPYTDLGSPPVDGAKLALEEADFIVSAGNGVSNVLALQAVAKVFGAAIGASRVAVDDGKFARDKQIGATGKTVNANVYMAIGISGAVQHLQGIRACRHVIAINTDASAPIAKRADLIIVDDAQKIMESLLEATRGRNFVEPTAEVAQ